MAIFGRSFPIKAHFRPPPVIGAAAPTAKLFQQSLLAGLGSGGPFFQNPLGYIAMPSREKWSEIQIIPIDKAQDGKIID